jgi:hypothetical protein
MHPAAAEDSIGVVDTARGEWYLFDPDTGATTRFFYGSPGDTPVVGDWDCDGDQTPGLYRHSDGYAYLRNSNNQGSADLSFYLGDPGDFPIAGDFDGDGCDTVGVYRSENGKVFIFNALGTGGRGLGAAPVSYHFGDPGDRAFVGDFDGDGADEVGLHRPSTGQVFIRSAISAGIADITFFYGDPGDRMTAGRWGREDADSVGLFRPSDCSFHLQQGGEDRIISYGLRGGFPLAGDFGDLAGANGALPTCPPCPPDPFTPERVGSLQRRFPGQAFTAHVYDKVSGCEYTMNPDSRQPTASVFKVMVMAGTLYEAQSQNRVITQWEMSQLAPMITESANGPVRALWGHFGGSPWYRLQVERFGLSQTQAVGDTESVWGRITTSATDQVDLIRQVIFGEWGPLSQTSRDIAHSLMTSVVPEQTWGVTRGAPSGWVVGQKNGFAGGVANSVGFVIDPSGGNGYAMAILSRGWSDWSQGVPAVDEIAGWINAALTGYGSQSGRHD